MTSRMPCSKCCGNAVSKSTPNGFDVNVLSAVISSASSPSRIVEAPNVPIPPASLTAATSS